MYSFSIDIPIVPSLCTGMILHRLLYTHRASVLAVYLRSVCTQALGGGLHKARTAAACIDMYYMGCSRLALDKRLIDR